jgi:hypothetical protein
MNDYVTGLGISYPTLSIIILEWASTISKKFALKILHVMLAAASYISWLHGETTSGDWPRPAGYG